MKESKTKEEYEEASTMLVASIAIGFIFGAGYGFLAFSCFLLIMCIYFIYAAKLSMYKAKKAAKKEQDDD